MTSSRDARQHLYELIHGVLTGTLAVDEFCQRYERTYNDEIADGDLAPPEEALFAQLYDDVLFFSPFDEDLRAYSGYKSAAEILVAVRAVDAALRDARHDYR